MPKLRHDCDRDGCFNDKHRPKIEVFDDCFPGYCAFGDVDAVVEINGRVLFLEFKKPGTQVPTGQRILHERLSSLSEKITIVVVFGDASSMAIDEVYVVHAGHTGPTEKCSLERLKDRLRRWSGVPTEQAV